MADSQPTADTKTAKDKAKTNESSQKKTESNNNSKSGPDKAKLKTSSTDKKLEKIMESISEMHTSLTQLANDFYGSEEESSNMRQMCFTDSSRDYRAEGPPGGYDNHVDWC